MPDIVTRSFTCGMPVIIEPIPGVRSCALTWLIPAGAAHDPADRLGLSALWAELLLRGCADMDSRAHADACDAIGMTRSVETGPLFLRIGATMLGDRLFDALPLVTDMVLRPRFEPDSLDPARELALMAIEALKDDPQERAMLLARSRHLPPPFDRSVLGTEEGLAATTNDDVRAHWSTRAVPRGSILAIAGAVDPDPTLSAMDRLLGAWTGERAEPAIGPVPARVYAHEPDESSQVQILVLEEAPADPHPSSMPERVATHALSGGMSGRLFTEVREKRGLCYAVSASYSADKRLGTRTAYVGTTPERAQESLDVLRAELARLTSPAGAVTPDEFRRAIVGMKSSVIFSGESTGARASALAADYHRRGRARSLAEIASEIDRVTLDQVNAHLATRAGAAQTIQTLGPTALNPAL
jgi:predicted Zn-dependent peptidase